MSYTQFQNMEIAPNADQFYGNFLSFLLTNIWFLWIFRAETIQYDDFNNTIGKKTLHFAVGIEFFQKMLILKIQILGLT